MPKRALIEHRPWLMAAIIAAGAYYFLSDNPIGGIWLMMLKGTGVALLAVYALRRAGGKDGNLLALALGLSACGDMLIEIEFLYGGTAFFLSHVAAIALYLRNPRGTPTGSQKAAGVALLLLTPVVSWLLSGDLQVGLYALALGGMAAAAWLSRFPRYRVGVGAVLFVISDLLIFSRMGPLDMQAIPDLLVWPIYFLGQFLIATGVVQTLRAERLATAWQR
ncbi:lysoplasmalogenase family protein [Parerythrobacter jejuensis]|uniref:Lysoplasmalogenase n=1 Tax=Parerythrobacter jejuensis TaxID=795812 RepID=A0A845ATE3_9SPHN|nr:lysoplasmalogenase family protein [Parerythrobacter jejuensis]MXP32403.1 lysoplasmalogenase [Parerythrobacter jejuensis]